MLWLWRRDSIIFWEILRNDVPVIERRWGGEAGRRKGTVLFQLDLQPIGVWVSFLFLKLVKGSVLHNTTWDIVSLVRLSDEELILSAQKVPIYPLCAVWTWDAGQSMRWSQSLPCGCKKQKQQKSCRSSLHHYCWTGFYVRTLRTRRWLRKRQTDSERGNLMVWVKECELLHCKRRVERAIASNCYGKSLNTLSTET